MQASPLTVCNLYIRGGSVFSSTHIESVPIRNAPAAIPLRERCRRDGKIRKLGSATSPTGPPAHVEALRGVLRDGAVIPVGRDAITVTRSLPHGRVAVALGTARKIGFDRILGPDGNRCRDLVLALLVGRGLTLTSKLAAARPKPTAPNLTAPNLTANAQSSS